MAWHVPIVFGLDCCYDMNVGNYWQRSKCRLFIGSSVTAACSAAMIWSPNLDAHGLSGSQ